MRVGLIGFGAIGKVIVTYIREGEVPGVELAALAENRSSGALEQMRQEGVPVVADVVQLLDFPCEVIIEAAGQDVVRDYAEVFLKARRHMMILSVGALADRPLFERLMGLARDAGVKIIVPSGAIGGLDAVKSARVGRIEEVVINNIKPPKSIAGAPYVVRHGIDPFALKKPTLIYEGFADEAAREFPKNLNVSVALSLAGIGPERTRVTLVVDPDETRNIHEITVRGEFGEARFVVAGLPSPDNPMTSYIASLSVIATLRQLTSPLQIGT